MRVPVERQIVLAVRLLLLVLCAIGFAPAGRAHGRDDRGRQHLGRGGHVHPDPSPHGGAGMTSRRILLIEDNEQNRYLVTYLLEAGGFSIPGMDGYTVARVIRLEPSTRTIPIVAVTSYAMVGDRERAIAAGCNGYVEKPIDPDSFVATTAGFLPAHDSGGPA